jgi:probable HAF family extracellular repeat protein
MVLTAFGCGGSDLIAPQTGGLGITTATSGAETDVDGYEVTIDAGTAAAIGANATLLRDNLEPGDHNVQLGGVADNCSLGADNPRAASVTAGQTTTVTFTVTCIALGRLTLTTQPASEGKSGVLLSRQPVIQLADEAGRPLSGVVVTAELASGLGILSGSVSAETDASGQAAFSDLMPRGLPGPHTLRFVAQGYTAVTSDPIEVAAADPGPLVALGTGHIWGKNNSGVFVGSIGGLDGGVSRAAVWQNHVPRDISQAEWAMSDAYDVNGAGQVVGEYTAITAIAFLWQDGVVTDLGTHGEEGWSTASAINNSGVIAGTSSVCTSCGRATVWEHGQTIDVGTLPAPWNLGSRAVDINDHGQVIGTSGGNPAPLHSRYHAFVWHDGVMVDLGTLRPDDDVITPLAINNRGQIIGHSSTGETYRPFIWENGVMRELVDPQGRVFFPEKLNDDGIVYGTDWHGDRALWQDGRVLKLPSHPGSGGWEDNDRGEILVGNEDHLGVFIIDRATVVHHVP